MFKRMIAAVMILAMTLCFNLDAQAALEIGNGNGGNNGDFHDRSFTPFNVANDKPTVKGDQWLIYWYACGTDIESGRILFGPGTDLLANKIVLAEPTRRTGDVTRCIRELERADLSSGKVTVLMQAGGTMIWGHEKFQANNALIDVMGKVSEDHRQIFPKNSPEYKMSNWYLMTAKNTVDPTYNNLSNLGTLSRYIYSDKERDWIPKENFSFNYNNPASDMGNEKCLEEFLRYGKEMEKELYPDGNVRRIFIFRNHGGGSLLGVCKDMYTSNTIPLQGIKNAFETVWGTSPENLNNPPFEVIGFDMCQMSTYETAVALEGIAHYMIASQAETTGRVSYDYDAFVSRLSQKPNMSSEELSKMICDTYVEDSLKTDSEYNSEPPYRREIRKIEGNNRSISSNEITVAVTDITKLPSLTSAYENFGNALRNAAGDFKNYFITQSNGVFVRSRNHVEQYGVYMVDLKDFAVKFSEIFPEVNQASDKLVQTLNKTVIYNLRGDDQNFYFTQYPNGGGLSTYYPLNLSTQRENIIFYSKLGNLAPDSMKILYIDMFNNNLSTGEIPQPGEKNQPNETNPPGDKVDSIAPSIPEDSPYDLSDLTKIEPEVDYDKKTASIHLTEEQLKRISGVRCQLAFYQYYEDDFTKQVEFLLLGGDTGIKENWKTGEFTSTFSGKWLKIDGHPVLVQVVTEATKTDKRGNIIGGYEIYEIPVILNDRHCTLSVSCEYPTKTYRILNAKPDSDTNIPVDEIYGLNKGDVIKPVYGSIKISVTKELAEELKDATESEAKETIKDNMSISLVAGDPFIIGDSVEVHEGTLPDGEYAYMFEFVNPVGGQNTYTAPVEFMIENGKISSAKKTHEEVEPENPND